MTDERPQKSDDANPPRRLINDKPARTPSRYRSFLLSTLFTYGGDR
ncbi:hypothetical protein [Pleomorphomonas koreensis]|nr:hypothetical protein [Pleomorphomonas koreensis]